MLLLPGSLPPDRATLKALCDGLAALPEVASLLRSATVAEYSGSWSDAEREASGVPGDLTDSLALASQLNTDTNAAVSVAIATPLHAALGLADLTPADPSTLSLSSGESRALCEAADAHMREDGVQLFFVDVARWLVSCNQPIDVLTERPDWIVGELLRPNLPRGRDVRLVERWMNELQMLLHAHPVNISREERGLMPVNLVWLWAFRSQAHTLPFPQGKAAYHKEHIFAAAIRNGNLAAWQATWQATWQSVSDDIFSAQTIILGDSHPRLRLTAATPGMVDRLLAPFKRKATLAEVLNQLQQSR